VRRALTLVLLLIMVNGTGAQEAYSVDGVPDIEMLIKDREPLPQPLEKDAPLLTLTHCLEMARDNHPALAASWAQVIQSKASLQQIWALYYPSLTFSFSEDIQKTFASSSAVEALALALGLQQTPSGSLQLTHTVFDGGERANKVESARQTLRASYLSFETAWISQAQIVQSAYLAVVKQEALMVISLLDFQRARDNQRDALRFLQAGTKSLIDLSQAEIQLAQAEANLAAQRNQVRDSWIDLAQATGAQVRDLQEHRLENLLGLHVNLPSYEEALKELDTHPQLLNWGAQALSSDAAAKAEKKSMKPNLGLSTKLQSYRDSGQNAGTVDLALTLTIPLYDPTVGPTVALFEAQAEEARAQSQNTRLQLLQDLDIAYSGSQGARERSKASLRRTKTALLNYELARKRYRAGLNDYTELLNALQLVSAAQSSYVEALSDERQAEVDLIKATGMAAKYTKAYFRSKVGEELLNDLREDLKEGRESELE
jgi:outer membrane protein TolC